jgi:hypothetical protein
LGWSGHPIRAADRLCAEVAIHSMDGVMHASNAIFSRKINVNRRF